MAKKKDSPTEETDFTVAAVEEIPPPRAPEPPPSPPPPAEPLLSFDRYFAVTGRPAHHKAGLLAFLNSTAGAGKRTRGAWDAIFARY